MVTVEQTDIPMEERRAHLTDAVFQEMIENPDNRLPFLVNWDQVFLAPM